MDNSEFPIIKVDFDISWDGDFATICDEITDSLSIKPDSTRSKETFKIKVFARNYWEINEHAVNCKALSIQTDKIIQRLQGKEEKLAHLAKKNNLSLGITIVIHANVGDGPEIVLTPKCVQFAAALGAEIGFDMYYYESEDE